MNNYVNPDLNLDGPIITPVPVIEPEPEPQPRIQTDHNGTQLVLPAGKAFAGESFEYEQEIEISKLKARVMVKYLKDVLEFIGEDNYEAGVDDVTLTKLRKAVNGTSSYSMKVFEPETKIK